MKYSYNKEFFQYWSHDLAYTLGFFCADGCLDSKLYSIKFGNLALKDIEVLEWLQDKICPEKPINYCTYRRKDNNLIKTYVNFSIHNKSIVNRILKLGFIHPKTGNEVIPYKMPKNLMPSFICGYFDGDGSVFYDRKMLVSSIVCQSQSFLQQIHKYINLGTINRDNSWYKIRMCKTDTIKFGDYIYSKVNFCLARKKNMFNNGLVL